MSCNGQDKAKETANASDRQFPPVFPGPCDPVLGCPPPTEIVCIKVDKVYESCSRSVTDEFTVPVAVTLPVTDVECVSAQLIEPPSCELLVGGRVRTTFGYTVTLRVTDGSGTRLVTSPPVFQDHSVPLARAGEPGLEPQCEVFLFCIDAFVNNIECANNATDAVKSVPQPCTALVTVCVGKLIIFKLFAHVQLLVPAYGFCPVPEECEVAGECPEFVPPDVIPYPPQILDDDD